MTASGPERERSAPMPFIVNGDGHLEVGPPEGDPLREDNARRVAEFAAWLEQETQVFDAFDAENERGRLRSPAWRSASRSLSRCC